MLNNSRTLFKHLCSNFQRAVSRKMCDQRVELDQKHLSAKCKLLAPLLTSDKHKGQAGRIGVFGGCLEYTGAPYYSAISSLKVGADLVYVFCMKEAATVIKSYSPELIVLPYLNFETKNKIGPWIDRLNVVLIGPGLGREESTFEVIREVIRLCREKQKPLVIDADGLYLLSININLIQNYPVPVIITPNAKEFERLDQIVSYKSINDNSKRSSHLFDVCPNLTVLEKGAEDLIYNRNTCARAIGSGSNRRSGGQGDLLAGSIATFLTWSLQNEADKTSDDRAIIAAYAGCTLVRQCNAEAFKKLGRSMTALDMINEIHPVFDQLFERKNN